MRKRGEIKNPAVKTGFLRGSERIRTAVDGFADHCLATRPRNHLRTANILINVLDNDCVFALIQCSLALHRRLSVGLI